VAEVEMKESNWGEPGSGDGAFELVPRRVTPQGASRFIVEWSRWDEASKAYVDDVQASIFTTQELKVLRRTAPAGVLAALDDVLAPGAAAAPAANSVQAGAEPEAGAGGEPH
jgi:hypothetical protein